MNKTIILIGLSLSAPVLLAAGMQQPKNLHWQQKKILNYVDSGAYEKQIAAVDAKALRALKKAVAENVNSSNKKKLAIVLDIDETSLSNLATIKATYEIPKETGDILPKKVMNTLENQFNDPAIKPTLDLYRYAIAHHVTVFFITGRLPSDKKATKANLQKAGYYRWKKLYLEPQNMNATSAALYKANIRKKITDKGYTIVLNIGDQESDLRGGYAEHHYKLPDPFYYIK